MSGIIGVDEFEYFGTHRPIFLAVIHGVPLQKDRFDINIWLSPTMVSVVDMFSCTEMDGWMD